MVRERGDYERGAGAFRVNGRTATGPRSSISFRESGESFQASPAIIAALSVQSEGWGNHTRRPGGAADPAARRKPRFEATLEACKLRLRPIMMTSFAFILGVVPLALAVGAGAEMRQTLGTAVFAGMLGVTLFGIFLTPVFFFVIQGIGESAAMTSPTAQAINRVLVFIVKVVLLALVAWLLVMLGKSLTGGGHG